MLLGPQRGDMLDRASDRQEPVLSGNFTSTALRLLDQAIAKIGGQQRVGQRDMAGHVAAACERGGTLVVQAGTGTGKSLGYLTPALTLAASEGKRVVVSTATLALQRQLLYQDVPIVSRVLTDLTGKNVTAAALKGWNNYVCRHKVVGGYPLDEPTLFDAAETQVADSGDLLDEHGDNIGASTPLGAQVIALRKWSEQTLTGDRDDLDFAVTDRAWRQVSLTKSECLGAHCPMADECFAFKAREDAHQADVIVTNHAMLGIAAGGNDGLIPEHDVMIVDEAHDLVSRVTSAASQELSMRAVLMVARSARREGLSGIGHFDTAAESLAHSLAMIDTTEPVTRLPEALIGAITELRDATRALISDARKGEAASATRHVALAAMGELFEISDRIVQQRESDVVWAIRHDDESTGRIYAAPLDVSNAIAYRVLTARTAVLTSATLVLGGTFEPFARSVGLSGQPTAIDQWSSFPDAGRRDEPQPEAKADLPKASDRWWGTEVESPFDYEKQAILYICRDLPPPGRDGLTSAHLDRIQELILASQGGALGLFTSRSAAQFAAQMMRDRLDINVLCQDDAQLPELIEQFKQDDSACLFGTLSLWQGIDVVGSACRLVIIDKIPFARPNDPVMSARIKRADERNQNGFMSVSATHAALLLAQGAGRLIRATTDRGMVAILDPRLLTKGYGSFLLRSLPPMWRTPDCDVALSALRRLSGQLLNSDER